MDSELSAEFDPFSEAVEYLRDILEELAQKLGVECEIDGIGQPNWKLYSDILERLDDIL